MSRIEDMTGYEVAALIDKQIADDVGLTNDWTGVDIRGLQERLKYIRTINTTCDLLEQDLNAALSNRLWVHDDS